MSDDGSSVGLVEEILEQQSAQALKLSHIDEAISELKLNLQRLADITTLAANNAAPRENTNSGHSHAIDSLEKEAQSAKGRMSLVLAILGLQTMLLIALTIFAIRPMQQAASSPAPAPTVVEAPKPQAPPPAANPAIVDPFKGASGAPTDVKEEEKPTDKVEKPGKKKKKK